MYELDLTTILIGQINKLRFKYFMLLLRVLYTIMICCIITLKKFHCIVYFITRIPQKNYGIYLWPITLNCVFFLIVMY